MRIRQIITLMITVAFLCSVQPAAAENDPAYQKGFAEGQKQGRIEGRQKGTTDGEREGKRDGERNGKRDGYRGGKIKGFQDGEREGREEGLREGRRDGEWQGRENGERDGRKRCYDEGFNTGYNEGYAEGYDEGYESEAYVKGYWDGVAKAETVESAKGHEAGYSEGFAKKEEQIRDSFYAENSDIRLKRANAILMLSAGDPSLAAIRNPNTPQSKEMYQKGYKAGYSSSYSKAYNRAKKQAYDQAYTPAYNHAHHRWYQDGYRRGYENGKDEAYREAYQEAYQDAYHYYYQYYHNLEYHADRQRGHTDGYSKGHDEGYQKAYDKEYNRGFQIGYDEKAAEVYPAAFAQGKKEGTQAAYTLYHKNAVLEMINVSITDEDNDSQYQTGEKIRISMKIANFGYVNSQAPSIKTSAASSGINLNGKISAPSVTARKYTEVSCKIGNVSLNAGMNEKVSIWIKLYYQNEQIGSKALTIKLTNFSSDRYRTLIRAMGWINIAKEKADSLTVSVPGGLESAVRYITNATEVDNLDTNYQVITYAKRAVNSLENSKEKAHQRILFAVESAMWTLERSLD